MLARLLDSTYLRISQISVSVMKYPFLLVDTWLVQRDIWWFFVEETVLLCCLVNIRVFSPLQVIYCNVRTASWNDISIHIPHVWIIFFWFADQYEPECVWRAVVCSNSNNEATEHNLADLTFLLSSTLSIILEVISKQCVNLNFDQFWSILII